MGQIDYFQSLRIMRIGALLSLITLLYGFCLGGVFGAFENEVMGYLRNKSELVLDEKYGGDHAKVEKVLEKCWTCFKRSHLHANGLGTASIALILFLTFLSPSPRAMFAIALSLGIGSLGYSLFWLFAGLSAPALGSTGAAKEALKFLAVPSSGLCILGLISTTYYGIKKLFLE